eukprot:gb/GECH01004314.1/.p1 GENE.gb/GECH01004314.1/~~gb/GECH01004314.1/.p1  ORF type:complete len:642 (+),score=145.40 gb/GECH01004314.1/:1-1926(+)
MNRLKTTTHITNYVSSSRVKQRNRSWECSNNIFQVRSPLFHMNKYNNSVFNSGLNNLYKHHVTSPNLQCRHTSSLSHGVSKRFFFSGFISKVKTLSSWSKFKTTRYSVQRHKHDTSHQITDDQETRQIHNKLRWNSFCRFTDKRGLNVHMSRMFSSPSSTSTADTRDISDETTRKRSNTRAKQSKKQFNPSSLSTTFQKESPSSRAVMLALGGNAFITIVKFISFLTSGSSAMLSEATHTLVDSINQVLLLFGLKQAERLPDRRHQYGYGRAAFFWSLISALGLFWVGSMATIWQGWTTIMAPPQQLEIGWYTWFVLAASFAIDGAVFTSVFKDLWRKKPKDQNLIPYLKTIKDPFIMAVLLEDFAACSGVLIASAGIWTTWFTNRVWWDGVASLAIGGLLGGVAIILGKMNMRFLIGQAVDRKVEDNIVNIVTSRQSVESAYQIQSQWVGPAEFMFKAEVDFNGDIFADKLRDAGYERYIQLWGHDPVTLHKLLSFYSEDVTRLVEQEIDSIEAEIRQQYPQASWIELEPSSPTANVLQQNLQEAFSKTSSTSSTLKPMKQIPILPLDAPTADVYLNTENKSSTTTTEINENKSTETTHDSSEYISSQNAQYPQHTDSNTIINDNSIQKNEKNIENENRI